MPHGNLKLRMGHVTLGIVYTLVLGFVSVLKILQTKSIQETGGKVKQARLSGDLEGQ